MVVTLPDDRTATLPDGFTIEKVAKHKVWADIIGRDTIRAGRPQTYNITYGNRGNIDARRTTWIGGSPKNAAVQLGFDITPPPLMPGQSEIDWNQIPIYVENGSEKNLPLFLPMIPTGSRKPYKSR